MAYSAQILRLQARLEAIPLAVREAVQPALLKSGDELADMMRHFAESSRVTGALIDSIAVTPGGESTPPYSQPGGATIVPENAVMITAGDQEVRYAHLVEYGTSKMKAEPFFWPAYRLLKKRVTARMKRAVKKAVRTEWDH
jgi:HK97 gp10 family phage protein